MANKIEEATNYLETGGLGEVLGLATVFLEAGEPKVQMDTDMAIALCMLADTAIKAKKSA
ncbi:hypothetical protein LB523_12235 [Mesorhizobium sp. ESP-6-4]|uniref:hypothetical protein n=1 Tax=Mesorhizobium sp. ESP-6-4 TaxID=2876624 RepID=UPI001CCE9874|nr:hypothetical protein [Mesorhizobium sp. ESP-6-4]MBZ9659815.1 hypothetical protein [Mesorhizobium sp. ESP-6-4]